MRGGEPAGVERAKRVAVQEKEAYEAGSDRPVGSFLAIMVLYVAGVGGLAVLLRRRGRPLPERIGLDDLPLLAVERGERAGPPSQMPASRADTAVARTMAGAVP